MDIMVSEKLETRIKKHIDEWAHETFFKGDELDEAGLCESVFWLYSCNMETKPEILIMDSPIGCQMESNKLPGTAKGDNFAFPLEFDAWKKMESRMYEIAWTNIWCNSLPFFKTSDIITRLNALGDRIMHHVTDAVKEANQRFYKFSMDNLFNRFAKVAFYEFIRGTFPGEDQPVKSGSYVGYLNALYSRNYIRFLKTGCFLSLFFKGLAVVSRRPRHIKFNGNGQLHCEGGAAIEWRDDWKIYYLNNVPVSEEIAVTPAESLNPRLILKEGNAEVKREIVRKIGIERVLQKLGGKVIDSWQDYELITLNIPDMGVRPTYLKMKNPSIGTYHVEGVPPYITTCRHALSWRVGGLNWNPKQLT